MNNIFLSVSHGFQVRNFLQSLFIHELTKEYHVVLIVVKEDEEHARKYLERSGLKNIEAVGVQMNVHKHEDLFLLLRKNIFVSPQRAATKNILNEMNNSTLGRWSGPLSVLNKIFGSFEASRSAWRWIENKFIDGHEFFGIFDKYKPVKVITGDYGTKPLEIRLIRAARKFSVKSVAVVPSWDNLTSKGVMGIKPDYLTVWNEIMEQEAIELHAFRKDRIFITGPLQFDNFFNPAYQKMSAEEYRNKFNVRDGQPAIVFGTITPKYFKYNLEVLAIMRDFIKQGKIKGNPKIIIRIHPQVVSDPILGDNLNEYRKLVKDDPDIFSLSLPVVDAWPSMQVPEESDFRELISILTYSNISIASASTLIFDSFACNSCFIGVGFDGYDKPLPKNRSVRRMFEFEHYKNVYAIKGFEIAESQDQLWQYINEYLEHPERHRDKQVKTLVQQVKFMDGKNFERVLKVVREI